MVDHTCCGRGEQSRLDLCLVVFLRDMEQCFRFIYVHIVCGKLGVKLKKQVVCYTVLLRSFGRVSLAKVNNQLLGFNIEAL